MTGIRERRMWPEGTRPSDASAAAGRAVLAKSQLSAGQVELFIHSAVSRDMLEPATAIVEVAGKEIGSGSPLEAELAPGVYEEALIDVADEDAVARGHDRRAAPAAAPSCEALDGALSFSVRRSLERSGLEQRRLSCFPRAAAFPWAFRRNCTSWTAGFA